MRIVLWDDDASLYQNRARWYDPNTGRFISEDAVGDGTNLYRYSGNDPINFRDPTGLFQAGNPLNDLALDLAISRVGGNSGSCMLGRTCTIV